jgi:formylmethanofuran dehydrogenase subunit E
VSDVVDQAQACEESVPTRRRTPAPRVCLSCGEPIPPQTVESEPDRLVCDPCDGGR